MDPPRTWDLVRPRLERRAQVLAPALPGHLGGPPAEGDFDLARPSRPPWTRPDVETAHLVGNSRGRYLAFVLATRGRAESVVALAPAGGADDTETLDIHERGVTALQLTTRTLEPAWSPCSGARVSGCDAAPLIATRGEHGWPLDALRRSRCPVRVLWGTGGAASSVAGRADSTSLLNAEWIELDGVRHAPARRPARNAQLILGFTSL